MANSRKPVMACREQSQAGNGVSGAIQVVVQNNHATLLFFFVVSCVGCDGDTLSLNAAASRSLRSRPKMSTSLLRAHAHAYPCPAPRLARKRPTLLHPSPTLPRHRHSPLQPPAAALSRCSTTLVLLLHPTHHHPTMPNCKSKLALGPVPNSLILIKP